MSSMLDQVGVLADFQQIYGQLAASCSAMADAIATCTHPHQVCSIHFLYSQQAPDLCLEFKCIQYVQNHMQHICISTPAVHQDSCF